MKKFFLLSLAAVSMLVFSSCSNSPETKAKKFAKELIEASAQLNYQKGEEINKACEEYYESLSDEDKEIFASAMEKYTAEFTAEYMKKAEETVEKVGNAFGAAVDGLNKMNDLVEDIENSSIDDSESSDDTENSSDSEEE